MELLLHPAMKEVRYRVLEISQPNNNYNRPLLLEPNQNQVLHHKLAAQEVKHRMVHPLLLRHQLLEVDKDRRLLLELQTA